MYQDIYVTSAGDQWDLISYQVYGHERYMIELLRANPAYRDIVVFDSGVELICPDIEAERASPLPAWKT